MAEDESGGNDQPIIIKKINAGHGHHGGAWKVAYADFVTAMMAFFLLMWLLNVTTEEQKNAISNYFDPTHPKVSQMQSGAGGVMGGTSMDTQGSMTSNVQSINKPVPTGKTMNAAKATSENKGDSAPSEADKKGSQINQAKEELRQAEEEKLKDVQDAIEQAMQENPDLAALAENLLVDMTPEGLRIQIVDSEGKSMFPSGSARMYQKTQELMQKVAEIIEAVPNEISIRGHTDSVPYGKGANYTNWELSTDRANASRRVLQDGGIPSDRLNNVVGKADTEHLLPDDPTNARNRRISIVLLREELTDPEAYEKRAEELAQKKAAMAAEKAKQDDGPPPLPNGDIPAQYHGDMGNPEHGMDDGSASDDGASGGPSSGIPVLPTPRSGDFEQTDGDVTFP